MSNFEEHFVSFDALTALITHATRMKYLAEYGRQPPDQLTSVRCYEAETLDNIVGEMRCLINEINKRSCYLKNVTAEDI